MNKEATNQTSSNRFERLRLISGLTQEELAKKFKVSVRTWRNWEKGETIPIGTILDIAEDMEKQTEFSFSQACTKLRVTLRISKRGMARKIGVDANTWLEWERGGHKPNSEARKKLEGFIESLQQKGELSPDLINLLFKRQMAA